MFRKNYLKIISIFTLLIYTTTIIGQDVAQAIDLEDNNISILEREN